ncbi:MAG TPA: Cd(II)/Pb(II)-responsive transcriptional regulator [Noviherbaspirillum sp.]|nr:Cd(II)/Pb(II)-responsive transcriptional regulator [Noviherbaspirillum sp.]
MKIGELAKATGCEVETIRYYEREGLLPAPPRSAANYRSYGPQHAERLMFIRHCRSLGMSLDDIRALQRVQAHPGSACDAVDQMLDRKLQETKTRIEELQRLEQQLQSLRNACRSHLSARECGILQNLQSAALSNECVCHH